MRGSLKENDKKPAHLASSIMAVHFPVKEVCEGSTPSSPVFSVGAAESFYRSWCKYLLEVDVLFWPKCLCLLGRNTRS